jgi:hypothetical protein
MNFWFLGGSQAALVDELTRGMTRVTWRRRVAAIGHGKRTNITPADAPRRRQTNPTSRCRTIRRSVRHRTGRSGHRDGG